MTYEVGGRQYVLISSGGHGKLGLPGEVSNTDG
jgi:glucose dehydrogenase